MILMDVLSGTSLLFLQKAWYFGQKSAIIIKTEKYGEPYTGKAATERT